MKLEVEDLHFRYAADRAILSGVSMSVASGSTVAFVGPSGCGKTTFLQILAGILGSASAAKLGGRVLWDGAADTLALRRLGKIGYMFQVPVLLPHLNILDNVVLPLEACGQKKDKSANRAKALSLLAKLGLARVAGDLPDQLSVGMRARVALARTFATEPSLLLLDEPFTSLDVSWRIALYQQWRSSAQAQRTTTILVTHGVSEGFLLADRVVVFNTAGRYGKVFESDRPKQQTLDLDSIRDHLRGVGGTIEDVQYAINMDVVSSTPVQLA